MRFLRNAMRKSKKEKPPTLYLPVTYDLYSKESALSCSSVFEDSDIESEDLETSSDHMAPPVLGLTIPGATGPYCPRRPTLQEVLSNTAPPPWTLTAFMAYLSQNHCLETLEFTMDASRYRKHYNTMLEFGEADDLDVESTDVDYVRMLWQKLTDAYLTPNGPREVNLPSSVRDKIIAIDYTKIPPHPDNLDEAVKIVYELMNESVLIPFLNSVAPLRGAGTVVSPWTSADDVPDFVYSGSVDARATSPHRRAGNTPLASSAPESITFKTGSPRQPRSSNLSSALRSSAGYRLSQYITGSTTSTSDSTEGTPIDDGRLPPTLSITGEPMTPPTTPPTADTTFSPGTSPRSTREGAWKNLGMKLGWKKSRSTQGSTSSMSSGGGSQSKISMVQESAPEERAIL